MDQQKLIFINPKFKNAYINPQFLKQNPNTIHINPRFLQHESSSIPVPQQAPQSSGPPPPTPVHENAIIKNTKRSLVRIPIRPDTYKCAQGQKQVPAVTKKLNLIKIGNNKLVNATQLMKAQQKENEIIKKTTESLIKSKKLLKKSENEQSIYKLDRRKSTPTSAKKKKRLVSTYTIRRVDDRMSPKKVVVTGQKLIKTGSASSISSSKNKKLLMVNGVLYKSSSTKLVKTSIVNSTAAPQEKKLLIRGQTFVLDRTGTKLQREHESGDTNLSRIDLGGLTYKKKESNGSYERDNSHQVRNHLTVAKVKSLAMLHRGKMRLSNVICPIYRRLGKCLAYANGRCSKVHDQRYVMVCPNFIKKKCENDKCLLSHNPSLHKMPVCKYYLQGQCSKSKDECLYLHKKLTDGTKLCPEFVKGYCQHGDQCNLLHDYPEAISTKPRYTINNRKRVRTSCKKEVIPPSNTPVSPVTTNASNTDSRYFEDDNSLSQTISNIPKVTKTAPPLPDFIKI